jgi:superfamily II DNA/RNA helicase
MSFQELNLHPGILKAIEELGYVMPTPIQAKAIPKILEGFDICASAQTGTGKTASFILPGLNRLSVPSPVKGTGPRILILVPTRELAMQVAAEAVRYTKYMARIKTVCIYGGAPYPVQNRQLARPYEILVATPGRLMDHMDRGKIDFSRIEMFILDEADRMLDMGFIQPVEDIAAELPKTRQTLMFSATIGRNIIKLSQKLLKDPIEIKVDADHAKHENIAQHMHHVQNIGDKNRTLEGFLGVPDAALNQVIIFTSTKRQADDLLDTLLERGHRAAALHGDMNQRQRTRTIGQLRDGFIKVLVATDVAARGIDVQTISHVINFDLPNNVEDYVHRIGRTGRASAKGVALSFVTPREMQFVRRIEQFTGQKMGPSPLPELESKSAEREGRRPGGGGGGGRFSQRPRPGSGGGGRWGGNGGGGRSGGYSSQSRSSEPRSEGGGERSFAPRARTEGNSERSFSKPPRARSEGGFPPRARSEGGFPPRARSEGGFPPRPRADGNSERSFAPRGKPRREEGFRSDAPRR